ncbi:butyrophilin subfamily 1 member A1-like [Patagioenas fasciata]|uniref:butyrophilin subfamily 1 member A1-like n=1 Tax=Patagioenas fasciata TaxID=372321 RepID=UPI003A99A552
MGPSINHKNLQCVRFFIRQVEFLLVNPFPDAFLGSSSSVLRRRSSLHGVRWEPSKLSLPETDRRFKSRCCVLGREGFEEGRHCWGVTIEGQVGGDSWWGLGVAKESVEKRDFGELSSDNGVWAVQHRNGQFVTLTSPRAPLALSPVPKSIWVFLDRAQGTVTFVDAGSGAEFCRFGPVSFGEEKIHPWFRVETAATRLCLRDGTPRPPRPPSPGDNGDPKSAPDTSLEPLLGGKGAEITLSPLPDQTGALGASAV